MGKRTRVAAVKKDRITLRSSHGSEFDSEVEIGGDKYLVQTEKGGPRTPIVKTLVYCKGRIVFTKQADYSDILLSPDPGEKLYELMLSQHRSAIDALKEELLNTIKTASDYLGEVRELVRKNRKENALHALGEALEHHPDDPFLLSYHGYLDAAVNKRYREGISECARAVEMLKKTVPFGEEFFYPLLYLNLGMAYLAAGKKKEALEAFNNGLEIDTENADLSRILRKLGVRKEPPIPFFERSHIVNKYLGKLLHRLRK